MMNRRTRIVVTLGAKISTFPECTNRKRAILNRVSQPLSTTAENKVALSKNLQGV